MITVGLDLSLTKTGVAVLEDGELLYSGLVRSKPQGDTPTDEIERIMEIRNNIIETIRDNSIVHGKHPDLVAIEGLAFLARNTSALVQLSGLNYMLREVFWTAQWPFVIVAPTTLKKFITGKGNAQKDLMLLETYKRYGVNLLDDNEVDAYGLAQIALATAYKGDTILTKQQIEVAELIKKQLA